MGREEPASEGEELGGLRDEDELLRGEGFADDLAGAGSEPPTLLVVPHARDLAAGRAHGEAPGRVLGAGLVQAGDQSAEHARCRMRGSAGGTSRAVLEQHRTDVVGTNAELL